MRRETFILERWDHSGDLCRGYALEALGGARGMTGAVALIDALAGHGQDPVRRADRRPGTDVLVLPEQRDGGHAQSYRQVQNTGITPDMQAAPL